MLDELAFSKAMPKSSQNRGSKEAAQEKLIDCPNFFKISFFLTLLQLHSNVNFKTFFRFGKSFADLVP